MVLNVLLQEVLDRAVSLAQEGEDLIQKSHYAQDSIQPKCTEISTISEDVKASLRARRDQLLKAMELHHALERVRAEREICSCVVTHFLL